MSGTKIVVGICEDLTKKNGMKEHYFASPLNKYQGRIKFTRDDNIIDIEGYEHPVFLANTLENLANTMVDEMNLNDYSYTIEQSNLFGLGEFKKTFDPKQNYLMSPLTTHDFKYLVKTIAKITNKE